MAAFFGLEYHRQRSRQLLTAAVCVLLAATIAGAAALLADRVGRSMRGAESSLEGKLNARLEANSAAQRASLDGVATAVERLRASSEGERKTAEKALAHLAAELQRLRRVNVNLQAEIERLRTATGTANPDP
jgi:hypothetical protein